jgi:hypothetical protein
MRWTEFRYRFLRMLRQFANVPEAFIAPKWIQFTYYVLFPLNYFYIKNSNIKYDVQCDIYTVRGIKFSGEVFMHLKNSIGRSFEITEINGTLCLRDVTRERMRSIIMDN